MAPLIMDDLDFVGTLSDRDDLSDENEEDNTTVEFNQNGTKRKRENGTKASPVKKQKKQGKDAETTETQPNERDSDVDSEFEFALEDGTAALEDFDGWAGEKVNTADDKKMVDINAIVARRIGKRDMVENGPQDTGDEESGVEEKLSNEAGGSDGLEDDEFDGFGAGADLASGENESGGNDENVSEPEESQSGSDEEENAAPTAHPDDVDSDSASNEEDAAEEERRNAFFAPDPTKPLQGSGAYSFHAMSLSRPILKGLAEMKFSAPTPIQAKTIPVALEGRDVVGGAVTGSGKTAAFMIPILERLLFRPKKTATTRVAILMPTRELALQCFNVARKLASFTDITFGQAIGGLNVREQEKHLKQRPDVVIATPGRFIDLERNTSAFEVNTIEILVLDEADRMLDEGFANELNEILARIPKSRQTMLFSATMTSKVDDLIRVGLQRPVRIMVDAQKSTVSGLVQEFVRLRPGREAKRLGYLLHLCSEIYTDRAIIFFRQKKEAHRVRIIFALCDMQAAELHGSMTQQQRIDAIEAFRTGKASFLLATDLASRGLDIKGIETVINYEAPQSHEIYLHRVGRTARAGRTGRACTLAAEPDRRVVRAAVKAARQQGAAIRQRAVDTGTADEQQARCDALADEVEAVLREEKEEKALAATERDVTRADNIITHRDEILARPRKTWFASEAEKAAAKKKGFAALNGPADAGEGGKKEKRKLSNKQKKRLQDRDDRKAGLEWKKGKAQGERGQKGGSTSRPKQPGNKKKGKKG